MLIIREDSRGRFFVGNLGQKWGGAQGREFFPLRIESGKFGNILEVEDVTVFDLDPKLKVDSKEYLGNKISLSGLVLLREKGRELSLEVEQGALYDLIKERVAGGGARISTAIPLSIYFRGLLEAA